MRLKNKMNLRDRLNHNNYDKIAIWADGMWAEVGDHYGGERSGDNPIFIIRRAYFGEMTHRAIKELFDRLETTVLEE